MGTVVICRSGVEAFGSEPSNRLMNGGRRLRSIICRRCACPFPARRQRDVLRDTTSRLCGGNGCGPPGVRSIRPLATSKLSRSSSAVSRRRSKRQQAIVAGRSDGLSRPDRALLAAIGGREHHQAVHRI